MIKIFRLNFEVYVDYFGSIITWAEYQEMLSELN